MEGFKFMEHVLSSSQWTREKLEKLFKLAEDISKNPTKYSKSLSGKVVATLFYEPSTRTRLSFESAVLRLGGGVVSSENAKEFSSAIKGETLEDTIRVVQGYVDAIVMRHFRNDAPEVAASVAHVPIINAGAGSGEHPTQSLLDLYTIWKEKGRLDKISVALLGDLRYGRTIHSLIKMLSLYKDITIYALSDEFFALPQSYIDFMKEHNMKFVLCESFDDIPKNIDVLYHTRIQKERIDGEMGEIKEFNLNKRVMKRFSEDSIILHPLPRNEEISMDLDDDKRLLIFKQAHNGMYVRMALLVSLFGGGL